MTLKMSQNPPLLAANQHADVRFRGKPLAALSPEEVMEALHQALTCVKQRTGPLGFFEDLDIGGGHPSNFIRR